MLSFPGRPKIYVAIEPCDMRKSFNGLCAIALEKLGEDPRHGAIFAFCNKRRDRLKLLYFDRTGLWVLAKRLEAGTFSWPQPGKSGQVKMALSPEALAMLAAGIDLRDGCRRAWYEEG